MFACSWLKNTLILICDIYECVCLKKEKKRQSSTKIDKKWCITKMNDFKYDQAAI